MVACAVVLFALHFAHLTADFPHDSPWNDWSKYTDEGWYGDAAIRHFLEGHWFLPGDFNPAVAMPVWPLLEAAVFRFTGVSLAAARALTVAVFGIMLVALYALINRYQRVRRDVRRPSIAAPLAVLFFCASPFFFVFDRLAILEPPLAMFTALALLAASYVRPANHGKAGVAGRVHVAAPSLLLGLLLAAMVLTKPTAVALLPAVLFLLWHKGGYRLRSTLKLAWVPALLGFGIWMAYYVVLVRPRYLEDYQYLFAANAYTGFQLQPLATVISNTITDGRWIGPLLYLFFLLAMMVIVVTRQRFFRNPLVPCFLLWMAGYFAFLAYHNNLQPRYYLLLGVPITALTAMALDELAWGSGSEPKALWIGRWVVVSACVLLVVVPDALQEIAYVRFPEYTYEQAAQQIARVVRADKKQSPLVLSVSGSDLTLMTGLPSIDDDFGTLDLDERVKQYRPGWYVAWNEIDDDKMDALQPLYHPVRVAAIPAMDDPDRNLLILYRLDPATQRGRALRNRRRVPKPLRTRLGQQPTTVQLQH